MNQSITTTLTPKKDNSKSNINEFLTINFIQHFSTLSDPRIERTKDHLLIDIVAIAILAVISGADGWVWNDDKKKSSLLNPTLGAKP